MKEIKLNVKELLNGSFHRLSHVYRYSSIPTIRKENVAEHSFYVAYYSYLIGKDLVSRGFEVDFGLLLSRALLHDLDESSTGDFLRTVKYGHPDLKKALDEVSYRMMEKMSEKIGVELIADWQLAKFDDLEGHIVSVADLARVVSYILEELRSGNSHMKPLLGEVSSYLAKLAKELKNSPVMPYLEEGIRQVNSQHFNDFLEVL